MRDSPPGVPETHRAEVTDHSVSLLTWHTYVERATLLSVDQQRRNSCEATAGPTNRGTAI